MKLSRDFIAKILRSVSAANAGRTEVHLIVKRPYEHLIAELHDVFGAQSDVGVKIDGRRKDRRIETRPIPSERRKQDRRKEKETLLELIIVA